MKAIDLISAALRQANIINEVETPTAEQGARGLQSLNDLITLLQAEGLLFGNLQAESLDDELIFEEPAKSAMKSLLAVHLCNELGMNVSNELAVIADRAERMLERLAASPKILSSSNLPRVRRAFAG